jgi:hypothetical protein
MTSYWLAVSTDEFKTCTDAEFKQQQLITLQQPDS